MSDDSSVDRRADEILARVPERSAEGVCMDDVVLLAFRAARLGEEEAAIVEQHLVTCRRCRTLLAGLAQPASEKLESWAIQQLEAGGAARKRRFALSAVTLAAAAALIFALLPATRARVPAYRVEGPSGGVEALRGEASSSRFFLPASPLKILLSPAEDLSGEAPALAVYGSDPGGPLFLAPETIIAGGAGGAFRIEGEARVLFGDRFGPKRVHVVLGADSDTTRGLAGLTEQEAAAQDPTLVMLSFDLEYRSALPEEDQP